MKLVPLPVALPLLVAAFMAATNKFLPRRVADVLAIVTSLGVGGVCLELMRLSAIQPIVYWFGGWTPRAGVALGISFVIDPMGASLAALVCLLVTVAFCFSWRYFDSIGTIYHALMLTFLGAMCGFSLTGDLFNLFVWFELMSASAFALCGYKIEEKGPLQGALNFAITNTIGAFLVLSGIALLYGRTGALNMAQIGRALGGQVDGLVITAFVFIMAGFFVKAAVVPFHFWLADAHAVAPTPVCVLLSGVMVELGLYAVARVYWTMIDGPFEAHRAALRGMLIVLGAITALAGAVMCFGQRHVKRLLAFSTVSHVGLLVIGLGMLKPDALAGAALYVLGHAMAKGALFLCAGILLHRLGTIDELELRGSGRRIKTTGAIWFIAGLGLAGCPGFATFLGESGITDAAKDSAFGWLTWIFFVAAVLTAGAVFRVFGRVFLGWGHTSPGGKKIPEERETAGGHHRVPAGMFLPAAVLAGLGLLLGVMPGMRARADFAAYGMADRAGYQARVLESARVPVQVAHEEKPLATGAERSLAAVLLALALAWYSLTKTRKPVLKIEGLRRLHSGHVGDYVAFLTFGVAAMGIVLAVLLGVRR